MLRTRGALQRFDELKQMELWKQKHCRHCPKCKRVVEKLSGCDHMVCGSDVHKGGNEQRGCGRQFSWASAPRYEADLRSAASDDGGGAAEGRAEGEGEGEAGRERRLQRDAREVHILVLGVPVQCDGCGEAIVGPRLQCVQCEGAVELCIACVGKVSGNWPAERLQSACRAPAKVLLRGKVFTTVYCSAPACACPPCA